MQLAFPLILSNSFWTLQITIDRVLLAKYDPDAVGAAMAAVLIFYTPLILLQFTANYATTFVAQYVGAGRPERVGPAVWQAIHFSLVTGLAFLALVPLAGPVMQAIGHAPRLVELETIYFECLCFSALPTLITAAACAFFAGRGDSWTVLLINGVGLLVNAVLDYCWIFGYFGFPEGGIAGAGWATVIGTVASAIVGMALMLRGRFRREFCTLSGWRLERELFWRLMRYGFPNGLHVAADTLAFTCFMLIVGLMGPTELAASSIAITINMVAFMPMLGMGQAVTVLVGQRLGQDRPELAEKTTWTGFKLAWLYMVAIAFLYVATPDVFLFMFKNESDAEKWSVVAGLVRYLLRFVAFYSIFDSMLLVFSFALRGAGDTRFVTAVSLCLSWPLMVAPCWLVWQWGWDLGFAWGAAATYVVTVAVIFWLRFRQGKWKTMRVIEHAPPLDA
jgi:MATE family multidrug resistance protein